MDTEILEKDLSCMSQVKYDDAGNPVGITIDEWFDRLGYKLIAHYGEEFRQRLNESRKQWNEKGRNFNML